MSRCRRCCAVWLRLRDGQVQRGCPHCWRLMDKHDEPDEELARRQVQRSIDAHEKSCSTPVRWPHSVGPTTVESAPRASAATRAARQRVARR